MKVILEAPIQVEVVGGEFQEEGDVTQELAPPKVILEAPIQVEVAVG